MKVHPRKTASTFELLALIDLLAIKDIQISTKILRHVTSLLLPASFNCLDKGRIMVPPGLEA